MVSNLITNVRKFLAETRAEFVKVIWPDRKYVTAATIIILVIVIAMSLFVMVADFSFSKIIDSLIKMFSGRA